MKLLFDQNISPNLAVRLADLFPDSRHVHELGMSEADDRTIWAFARDTDFVIATKDRDFLLQCAAFGHPPRVVLLRVGNCSVAVTEAVIRANRERLHAFAADLSVAYIALGR